MRKNLNKIFFGIAVLAAGIIFLGSAFGFWEIGEMSGWWTVFIIVPAIGSRENEPFRYCNRPCHRRLLADIQHGKDKETQKASR